MSLRRWTSSSVNRIVSVPCGSSPAFGLAGEGASCSVAGRKAWKLVPLPGGALDPHAAVVLPYDAKDGGQPEARAFARLLGGEERFKDMGKVLGCCATSSSTTIALQNWRGVSSSPRMSNLARYPVHRGFGIHLRVQRSSKEPVRRPANRSSP